MKALLTAEINELKAARRNGNVPKDLVDRIRQAVEQAEAAAEAKAETPEQTVQRLWGEVKRLNEEIKLDLEELHKRGLVGDEEYEKLKKERARLDQLDPSDPKRMEGEKAYNSRVDALATKAGEKAEDIGDHDGKKVADDVKKKTREKEHLIEELDAVSQSGKMENLSHKSGTKATGKAMKQSVIVMEELPSKISVAHASSSELGALTPEHANGSIKAPAPSMNFMG